MHFDIDLHTEGGKFFQFHGHLNFFWGYEEVILDPSVLFYLTNHEINETSITYYLPDNLIRLIKRSKESNELSEFLKSFLTYFRYGYSKKVNNQGLKTLYQNIERMIIKPISIENLKSEKTESNYEKYLMLFSDHDFYISLSPRINFLGDCVAKIMEFSKYTGRLILSKSRRFANLLREKIISIELPKRIDNVIHAKNELLNRMFEFKGGESYQILYSSFFRSWGIDLPRSRWPQRCICFCRSIKTNKKFRYSMNRAVKNIENRSYSITLMP